MTSTTPAQLTVVDLFGNSITVTDLDKAIAEREACVEADMPVKVAPFTFKNGVAVTIPGRASERVELTDYHKHLLGELLALKSQVSVKAAVAPESAPVPAPVHDNKSASLFIVRVASTLIDRHGIEVSQIAEFFVPVEAENEVQACQRAVLWHGDNGVVVEDEDLLWKVDDKARGLSFKATSCLCITDSEMDFFLSVTQGVSTGRVIGRTPAGFPESSTVKIIGEISQ